jgi:flagellin
MSGIVLSASVRQNLLSLQSTAALDNPTNYFTAQSLDARAGDINNLLDGIGNGVQVLQAANTGITSLQKLVDTAKSLANQALQSAVGYSTKSNVSATITGATSNDLRGTTTYTSATATSNVLFSGAAGGTTPASGTTTLGGTSAPLVGAAAPNGAGTAASLAPGLTLAGAPSATTIAANGAPTDGETLTVNGKTITFKSGSVPAAAAAPAGSGVSGNIVTDGNGNSTIYFGTTATPTATVADLTNAIDLASGVQKAVISAGAATLSNSSGTNAAIAGGVLTLNTGTGADLSITGRADLLKSLGLTASVGSGDVTVTQQRQVTSASTGTLIQDGSTLNVNGKIITFKNAVAPLAANVPVGSGVSGNVVTDGNGNSTVYLQGGSLNDTLKAIDIATGVQTATNVNGAASVAVAPGQVASSIVAGALQLSTGTTADLAISGTGNALSALGLTGNTGTGTSFNAGRSAAAGSLSGKTLTFTSFNGGTPVNVTFGDGSNGTVKTLDQLNNALLANNLAATVDSTGKLTITTTNDYASSTLGSVLSGGAIGGTLTSAVTFTIATAPVVDITAQNVRSNLVTQFNGILSQITTTAQDASFNGINLLGGDQLKLTFNETGKSTLNITGVNFNAAGLGLANLVQGTDFIDNSATNKVITNLAAASTQLRTQASALGSNLSIVQIRQDFSKNLINVLQTGSSNLTLADTNEEAANSQALSTRQSIAVSALALANQSQQSVLQLLR